MLEPLVIDSGRIANEMEEIIAKYPQIEDELLAVKGFGKAKVEKYGQAIIRLFHLYSVPGFLGVERTRRSI